MNTVMAIKFPDPMITILCGFLLLGCTHKRSKSSAPEIDEATVVRIIEDMAAIIEHEDVFSGRENRVCLKVSKSDFEDFIYSLETELKRQYPIFSGYDASSSSIATYNEGVQIAIFQIGSKERYLVTVSSVFNESENFLIIDVLSTKP